MFRNENNWMDSQVDSMLTGTPNHSLAQSSRFDADPVTGKNIRFRLGDVYAPSLTDLYRQITPGLELEGQIILLSDGGDALAAYALVEVPGVMLPLIVPVSCLEPVYEDATASEVAG